MNNILFGISLAALLSVSSLLMILLRVSPLIAPVQAVTTFFLGLFLSVTSLGALAMIAFWRFFPHHTWDFGKITSAALREGIFLGCSAVIILLFHFAGLLNWWIGLMVIGVFLFIELALVIEK